MDQFESNNIILFFKLQIRVYWSLLVFLELQISGITSINCIRKYKWLLTIFCSYTYLSVSNYQLAACFQLAWNVRVVMYIRCHRTISPSKSSPFAFRSNCFVSTINFLLLKALPSYRFIRYWRASHFAYFYCSRNCSCSLVCVRHLYLFNAMDLRCQQASCIVFLTQINLQSNNSITPYWITMSTFSCS